MAEYDFCPLSFGAHAKILRMAGAGQYLLDVGCGRGHLSQRFTAQGNRVIGLEKNEAWAREAEGLCEKVIRLDLDNFSDLPLERNSLDGIILASVLEHTREPAAVVQKLRPYLKNGGWLIVVVPNVVYLSQRLNIILGRFDYTEGGLLDRTHLRFFTLKSFRDFLANLKLKTIELDYSWPKIWSRIRLFPSLFALEFIAKVRTDRSRI